MEVNKLELAIDTLCYYTWEGYSTHWSEVQTTGRWKILNREGVSTLFIEAEYNGKVSFHSEHELRVTFYEEYINECGVCNGD